MHGDDNDSDDRHDDVDFDMSEFLGLFVEEAREHLQEMEALLLALRVETVTPDELNRIFRAAHSIKGGSATFGLHGVTELAHVLESLLDLLRERRLVLTTDMVDALLRGSDMIGAQIGAHEGGPAVDPAEVARLCACIRGLADGGAAPVPAPAPAPAPTTVRAAPAARPIGVEGVAFGFFDDDDDDEEARDASGVEAEAGAMLRTAAATAAEVDPTSTSTASTRDSGSAGSAGSTATPAIPAAIDASKPAGVATSAAEAVPAAAVAAIAVAASPPASTTPASTAPPAAPVVASAPAAESSSIRVGVEKVDQIINLVGELVITQAMLAQGVQSVQGMESVEGGHARRLEMLRAGLEQLERNTRALQEAAMAMRMMPVSTVFHRFPRVVRDVAARLGKEVELKLVGEATELDKGLVERIVDPLTHLVRNSLDHGLEAPAERIARGKPLKGTLTLSASHQGGNVVIEVSDDGRGLDRERILAKARERGIVLGEHPSDAEVWGLIFEAGFSTAERLTEVSGRGVGMDVVRSNIVGLGGRVEIHSEAGVGTRMTVRLPLTLAILDGMSVACGGETFIVPLALIVESLRPARDAIRTLAGQGRVLQLRGRYLPLLSLRELLGLDAPAAAGEDPAAHGDGGDEEGIVIVIDSEETRLALRVDALLGQHQVVIKSLETHYRKVPGISGATIMGDGRVALILDAAGLGRLASRQRRERATAVPSAASAAPAAPAVAAAATPSGVSNRSMSCAIPAMADHAASGARPSHHPLPSAARPAP